MLSFFILCTAFIFDLPKYNIKHLNQVPFKRQLTQPSHRNRFETIKSLFIVQLAITTSRSSDQLCARYPHSQRTAIRRQGKRKHIADARLPLSPMGHEICMSRRWLQVFWWREDQDECLSGKLCSRRTASVMSARAAKQDQKVHPHLGGCIIERTAYSWFGDLRTMLPQCGDFLHSENSISRKKFKNSKL